VLASTLSATDEFPAAATSMIPPAGLIPFMP
jgi:hypothetical protein